MRDSRGAPVRRRRDDGRLCVYDTTTPRLVRAFDTNLRALDSFVNDVTLTPNRDAFFTDSRRCAISDREKPREPVHGRRRKQARPGAGLDL